MKKILLPISMFLFFAVGCDNPMLSKSTDLDSEELQALSYELSSDLGLSESSTDGLNDILQRHGRKGKHREPGFLWKVAGELADSLSDDEKAMLFEKMDDKDIPLFGINKKRGSKSKGGKKGKNDFGGIIKVLNDDQKVIFKEILTSYKEKFKDIHLQVKDGTLSKDNAKLQLESLKEAMKAEIDFLLTDDQKVLIEENQADKKAKHQAYMDSSKAVKIDVLGMSSDQVTIYESIKVETREAAKALFVQSKNGEIDRESFRVALKNLFTTRNEKFEALFTTGQLEIIKIHKALQLRMKKHKSQKGKKGGGSKKRGGRKGKKG
jgi:hypothetical protein